MPRYAVDPSRLSGEDLRRWYTRTPAEIEQQRQAEVVRRHRSFFGGLRFPDLDPESRREPPLVDRDQETGTPRSIWPARYDDPGLTWDPFGAIRDRGARPAELPSQSLREVYAPLRQLSGNGGAWTATSTGRPSSNLPSNLATGTGGQQPPSAVKPAHHAIWAAGRQPGDLDPSITDVFEPGEDGKLHPVPGWRTTGPFAVDDWLQRFDWDGVAQDLAGITTGALTFLAGGGLGTEVLNGLGYRIGPGFIRGIIEGHHALPKFMGGPNKQELAALFQSLHREFHVELSAALRKAGFPRVGGKGGGANDWADFFEKNIGKRDEALQILQDVTRSFDKQRGTKISKYLDAALTQSKTPPPTPPQ